MSSLTFQSVMQHFGAISQNKIYFHFVLEWWCSHSPAANAGIWETKHIRRFKNTLFTILILHTFQWGGLGGGGTKIRKWDNPR